MIPATAELQPETPDSKAVSTKHWREFKKANSDKKNGKNKVRFYTPKFHTISNAILANRRAAQEVRLREFIERHSLGMHSMVVIDNPFDRNPVTLAFFEKVTGESAKIASEIFRRKIEPEGWAYRDGHDIVVTSDPDEIRNNQQAWRDAEIEIESDAGSKFPVGTGNLEDEVSPSIPPEVRCLINSFANPYRKKCFWREARDAAAEVCILLKRLEWIYRRSPEYAEEQTSRTRKRKRKAKGREAVVAEIAPEVPEIRAENFREVPEINSGDPRNFEPALLIDVLEPLEPSSAAAAVLCTEQKELTAAAAAAARVEPNSPEPADAPSVEEPVAEVSTVAEESVASDLAVLAAVMLEEGLTPDDDALTTLLGACRKRTPDATAAEIAHFVRVKIADGHRKRYHNLMGFVLTAVPPCFERISFQLYRLRQVQESAREAERIASAEAALEPEIEKSVVLSPSPALGTAAIPASAPPEIRVRTSKPKSSLDCHACGDKGTIESDRGEFFWCDCAKGRQLQKDMPQWLDTLTALSGKPRPAAPLPPAPQKPITHADIDAALDKLKKRNEAS